MTNNVVFKLAENQKSEKKKKEIWLWFDKSQKELNA